VAAVDIQRELEGAIANYADEPNSGLIVLPHPQTIANRGLINSLSIRYRMSAIYPYRYFAADGGLIAYGPDQIDQWRGAARYVDRILKGEKPADPRVQAPTRYELAINLKTAQALGLTVRLAGACRQGDRQTTMGIRMMRVRQCKLCKRSQLPELESSSTKLVRIADVKKAASVGGLFYFGKKNDATAQWLQTPCDVSCI